MVRPMCREAELILMKGNLFRQLAATANSPELKLSGCVHCRLWFHARG